MNIDIDTLVGRLMALETSFYELQSRYHSLINDYEKLKEEHIPDGNWQFLTDEEKANLVEDIDWYNYPEFLVEATEEKLKAKNEKTNKL